jgi:glycosyltransferase involved in cell wall biosynthesis
MVVCPHGVDIDLFKPGESHAFDSLKQPVFLYVGRVAVEKGIDKFLALDLPGTKVVVGDGPERKSLEKKFAAPNIHFVGKKHGEDLVAQYQAPNVVVFPSVTDTFGNVNVEALACGKPVAGFPASGIKDIIRTPQLGALDNDLRTACMRALVLSRDPKTADACRKEAVEQYRWDVATTNFLGHLVEVGAPNLRRYSTDETIWATVAQHRHHSAAQDTVLR